MKLGRFIANGESRIGAFADAGIYDLTGRIGVHNMEELIARWEGERAQVPTTGPCDYRVDDVRFDVPVARPEKIWCIGVNYQNRNAEYKDGSDLPRYPSLFVRSAASFVGAGEDLERPKVSEQLDYEGEIAIVIGKPGRHIAKENAFSHIFGLTLANEGSVRDWLHHGKFNVTQGKNFDRSGSIGPYITTVDAVDPRGAFTVQTRVNGALRQNQSTSEMMFPFDFLLSYLSTFATLNTGDIILTGTPTGTGARQDPPVWLKPGDTVEVTADGLGTLTNGVRDET